MRPEPFTRNRATPECLSSWAVSQYALGICDERGKSAAEAHLALCTGCQKKVEDERAQSRADAYTRVPEALLHSRAPTSRSAWARWVIGGLGVAIAASLMVLVSTPDGGQGTRLKGRPSLELAINRQGQLMGDAVAAEKVEALESGDRLRLRVVAPSASFVTLSGEETGAWVTYFEAPLPEDRWLPIGLTVTPTGKTRLRLSVCDLRDRTRCDAQTYEWTVRTP